jgi:hypothetical protein
MNPAGFKYHISVKQPMATYRQYSLGLGLILFLAGVVLIAFSPVLTFEAVALMVVGGVLILGGYLFTWLQKHLLVTVAVVVVALILIYIFLPSLAAISPRFTPVGPLTERLPTSADAVGQNCELADLGDWTNREGAFIDNSVNSDTTSASAEGDPAGASCDDWAGFLFDLENHTVTSVKVTVEWQVSEGTAALRVAPFTTGSNATECADQSTGVTEGPSAYQVATFDFTDCKDWQSTDFNDNTFSVTLESVPEIQSTVFVDYIKVSVQQSGQVEVPPDYVPPAITPEQRALITWVVGLIALSAAVVAGGLWLLKAGRTRLFKSALLVAVVFGLGWFLLSYVIR